MPPTVGVIFIITTRGHTPRAAASIIPSYMLLIHADLAKYSNSIHIFEHSQPFGVLGIDRHG